MKALLCFLKIGFMEAYCFLKEAYIPIIMMILLISILGIYSSGNNINSICIVKLGTGYPCPGCGMTRAHLALLHFDFRKAFYYHPLFFFPSLYAFLYLYRKTRIGKWLVSKWIIHLMILGIFVGIYIYRMVTMFPNQVPLDFLEDNLIHRVLSWFFI